jgi:hypothetical protein
VANSGLEVAASTPATPSAGEETALLEVLDGRLPFPRIAPPFLDLPGDSFLLDEAHATKQPDWSFDDVDPEDVAVVRTCRS